MYGGYILRDRAFYTKLAINSNCHHDLVDHKSSRLLLLVTSQFRCIYINTELHVLPWSYTFAYQGNFCTMPCREGQYLEVKQVNDREATSK